ncbi:BTK motif [Carpediemonas membranifera]|uniref:BTK motif n=1 Tax=Carpediemonas membranifera TaxID=201153 RepID=A0A8J6B301_9EUKA|nr:BTK motif [Carpediemonas membranifera]|eukprot:KAG9397260.1 BTK motif [Carpediemonas membranifera]
MQLASPRISSRASPGIIRKQSSSSRLSNSSSTDSHIRNPGGEWNNSVSMPQIHSRDRVTHVHSTFQSIKPMYNFRAKSVPKVRGTFVPKPTRKWEIDPLTYMAGKELKGVTDKPQYLSDRVEWEPNESGEQFMVSSQIDYKNIADRDRAFMEAAKRNTRKKSESMSTRRGVRTDRYEPPEHRVHRQMLENRMRRVQTEFGVTNDDEEGVMTDEVRMKKTTTPMIYTPGVDKNPDEYLPWRHSEVVEEYERVASVMASHRPSSQPMPGLQSTAMLPTLEGTPGARLVHVTKIGSVDPDDLGTVARKTAKKVRVFLSEKEKDDIANCTFKPKLITPAKWDVHEGSRHSGVYGYVPSEGKEAWSCCLAYSRDAPGCQRTKRVANKHVRSGFCI